jgi:TPR repeat protein
VLPVYIRCIPIMKSLNLSLLALLAAVLLPGAVEQELKDASGKTIVRYVVEPPLHAAPAGTTDPSRQLGLILCSAEHDRPTGDEILPVREALIRLGIRDGYVLLSGHSQNQKFGAMDDEPLGKLMEWAKKTYPINPRRVYMYGKGEGGKISGEFTMLHPDLVTAAISYSWGWWRMPAEDHHAIDPVGSGPEFYMVLGLRDLSYHLTTVRDSYLRVSTKGYHIVYREFGDLGARTYHQPSNDEAMAWATRLRNKNIPPSPDEMKMLKAQQRIANGYFPGLALVGGIPAGDVLQQLLSSKDAAVRAAAAETLRHGAFGEAAVAALAARANDPAPEVRRAVIRGLAAQANWRSDAAQQALIELATDPTKTADQMDRVAAVDGLISASRLQITGAIQDPALFRALVSLLDDKDEELRTMASNFLAPVRDRDFRGDLGRTEQKTPAGGWPRWLDSITAKAAGYSRDYEVCAGRPIGGSEPVDGFCKGQSLLKTDPAAAFQATLAAAEQGFVPAQAAVGIMLANGKGAPQNYPEAAKWWNKAAESGHLLAAGNLALLYRGGSGIPGDAKLSAKWAQFVEDHSR